MKSKSVDYPEPIRPGVRCLHCYGELEATGEYCDAEYRTPWNVTVYWRHVDSGKKDCTTTNRATPASWPAKPWFDLLEVALAGAAGKDITDDAS